MRTLGFKEKEKGWVSFFSFTPQAYLRLGGVAYAIHQGNLWQQNDKNNPIVNTFFGVRYPSKISTVFNEAQTEDKIFKTFVIEGSASWYVSLKTNLTETTLVNTEFEKKESRYFAYLRGNENETDFNGNSQGIGVCMDHNSDTFTFQFVSELVNVGDTLFVLDNDQEIKLGVIKSKTPQEITIDIPTTLSFRGMFFFSAKNSRIDGGEIRGYYADVELTNNDGKQVELFAINSNIVKSYV
jgi:hypothetical protein